MQEIRALGERLLPPFPGPEVIQPAVTPPPRLLPPTTPSRGRAEALYAAWRGAAELRFPELFEARLQSAKPVRRRVERDPFWGDLQDKRDTLREVEIQGRPRFDITKFMGYGLLVEAAKLLIEREIPPASWCLFSVDTWMFYVGDRSNKPPKLNWTYSAKRIVERADWYRDEAVKYAGGQTYYANEHKALLLAHRALWSDLLRARPKSRSEVAAVVDRHFPGGTWELRVQTARLATKQVQALLDGAVARGVAW